MSPPRALWSNPAAGALFENHAVGQWVQKPEPHAVGAIERLRAFYGDEAVAGAYIACTTEVPSSRCRG